MSHVHRHIMLCKTCCNAERSELPKMLASGLNWDVQRKRNELGAEIPLKQMLDAWVPSGILAASMPKFKQNKTKQNSNSFLNQRLQVVLKYYLHNFLACLNFCRLSFSWGLLTMLTRMRSWKPYKGSCLPEKAPIFSPAVDVCKGVGNVHQNQLLQPEINANSQPTQHLLPCTWCRQRMPCSEKLCCTVHCPTPDTDSTVYTWAARKIFAFPQA